MAKKGSTLTLRLSPEENKKLTILKEFLRARTGTGAIMQAIEMLPEAAKTVDNLRASLQNAEKKISRMEWENSQIKKSIRDVIEFSKISKIAKGR